MSVKRLFNKREQFFDANGDPLDGGLLFLYLAGSSTRATSYNSDAGSTPNANPLVLDSAGRLQSEVWVTAGASYKLVMANSGDGDSLVDPSSPIWTEDDITGLNDATTSVDIWAAGPAPTYVSASSLTLAGDQTSTFKKRRRVKVVDAGGTKYATLTDSAYAALTTLTLAIDGGGSLSNPISSIFYSLVDPENESVIADAIHRKGAAVASAATADIWAVQNDSLHITGTTDISSFGTAPFAGLFRTLIFDSALNLVFGTNLQTPGQASLPIAAGDTVVVYSDTTSVAKVIAHVKAGGILPAMHMRGLVIANNAGDATNDIDISVGEARDSTNAGDLVLSTAITKRLDAAWAVGTNQGGLDTGVIGNSDYYVHLIKRVDTGVVDALFSLSATAPTMPANYTLRRLIGWFKRVGGAILAFHAYETEGGGLELNWDVPTLDVNLANTLTTSRRTDAVKVPLNFSTEAHLNVIIFDASATAAAWICCPDQTDAAPSLTAAPLANAASVTVANGVYQMKIRTSATGTIAARAQLATVDSYFVATMGFRWARRN